MPYSDNVVEFNAHRFATAKQVLLETRNASKGEGRPLEEALPEMADFMSYFLTLILSEFDYNQNRNANLAIACRGIAAVSQYFDEKCGDNDHE